MLTEDDHRLLKLEIERIKTGQIVFTVVFIVLAGVAWANSVFAWWNDTVTFILYFFSSPFILLSIVNLNNYLKIRKDIAENRKEVVSGKVSYKNIGKRTESHFFERSYLEEIAAYQEDKKLGIKKDYGSHEARLVQDSGLPFNIKLDDSKQRVYSIEAKHYLLIDIGDTVVMEVAPRSRVVLRLAKA